ncbi:hypothetical protein MTX26_07575 [Bradyrhizobium sp. ISRA443]|uniref:hypothetical protein n=1 Tax=unclassified Bradyrhizobium TaxID=2631580 RepID=UPI00247A802C|nr:MULTISPECIES: hypothetical protein [unclassified Bradyrhizobium]WGR95619.1 hypothetical protein MTX20_17835 [Bradyrhizobium sp. ISRA435]WGS00683.1 hypothetical protein MTX23_07570 [Bradyrhizobium sp. ISRA436]WGS07571.1 hypothetical protein MTX18_07575 [Bradyrhizobium sp. ISRA437]WGS14458.1 hypothetical protein MTX26_07575 [Bradyrhizobium sp. ISRA443]
MSEQQSESLGGEIGAEMAAKTEPVLAAADAGAVRLSPDQEETSPKADAPRIEAPKIEPPKIEPARVEPPKMDAPRVEAGKRAEPHFPGKMMIMAPGDRTWNDRTWDHEASASKPASEQAAKPAGTRRVAAMAAVIALAAVAGAIGGAFATTALGHFARTDVAAAKDTPTKEALDASIARIDGEIAALKSSIDQTARNGSAQLNKTNDRLEKVEKAQAEPMAKLAKLSETVEKLRTTPQVTAAATPAAAREVAGTVTPPTAATASAPKVEVGRLPVVEGWALRDVGNGSALIEGRGGIYEVYAGDPVPGLGRVDAIRRQDGRWVVVTSRGLIVAR